MKANAYDVSRSRIGLLQIGIILLTLFTAAIHLVLAFATPDPMFTPLFVLNGIGYLVLLAGLFLPIPFAQGRRGLFRWGLIGLAALTIIAWLILGDKSLPGATLAYVTKAVEVALIVLLLLDRRS